MLMSTSKFACNQENSQIKNVRQQTSKHLCSISYPRSLIPALYKLQPFFSMESTHLQRTLELDSIIPYTAMESSRMRCCMLLVVSLALLLPLGMAACGLHRQLLLRKQLRWQQQGRGQHQLRPRRPRRLGLLHRGLRHVHRRQGQQHHLRPRAMPRRRLRQRLRVLPCRRRQAAPQHLQLQFRREDMVCSTLHGCIDTYAIM